MSGITEISREFSFDAHISSGLTPQKALNMFQRGGAVLMRRVCDVPIGANQDHPFVPS